MNEPTLPNRIESILLVAKIGGEIDVAELVKSLYEGEDDYFIRRSFDVHYIKAKRSIYLSKGYKFERREGKIIRIQNKAIDESIEDYFKQRPSKVRQKIYYTGNK